MPFGSVNSIWSRSIGSTSRLVDWKELMIELTKLDSFHFQLSSFEWHSATWQSKLSSSTGDLVGELVGELDRELNGESDGKLNEELDEEGRAKSKSRFSRTKSEADQSRSDRAIGWLIDQMRIDVNRCESIWVDINRFEWLGGWSETTHTAHRKTHKQLGQYWRFEMIRVTWNDSETIEVHLSVFSHNSLLANCVRSDRKPEGNGAGSLDSIH